MLKENKNNVKYDHSLNKLIKHENKHKVEEILNYFLFFYVKLFFSIIYKYLFTCKYLIFLMVSDN